MPCSRRDENWMAAKILKNANVSLPWVDLGKTVRGDIAQFREKKAFLSDKEVWLWCMMCACGFDSCIH